jgi:DNA primase
MAIPQSFLQDLLSRVDVVDVVGRYVQLKKGGANFMGLCPFHGEKSPSFSVSPTKQFYHCFGCGKNGDAIRFLMEHTGMSFIEAVKDLAQEVGMTVPEDERSPEDRQRAQQARERQRSLNDVLAQAAQAYQKALKASPNAIDYLKGRGLSGQIAKRFGLGYAPPGWRHLAGVFPDYQDSQLVDSGLVISHAEEGEDDKRYDRFRDRVMFPIRNVKGEHIGFGGRVLGQGEPKYLNSPETPVFHKGSELYGLFEGRKAIQDVGHALVVEGYMDVVALAQMGVAQAVATLGTACTDEHVRKLLRFTDTVVFAFDGDAAGRRAAHKAMGAALPFATDTRTFKFLFLPSEHDPDSFVRAHGATAFESAIAQATPLSQFIEESACAEQDLNTLEGRAHALAAARPLWQALPDGVFKQALLKQLAQATRMDDDALLTLWQHPEAGGTRTAASSRAEPEPTQRQRTRGARPAPSTVARVPSGPRHAVLSRADWLVRWLLLRSDCWGRLSTDDQHLLAELPEPHGALFAWLEGQWHERGAQPWSALSLAIAHTPWGEWAHGLVARAPLETDAPEDAEAEVQQLLARLRVDRIKAEQTALIARANEDPQALARWRELDAQLKTLLAHEQAQRRQASEARG